MYVLYKSVIAAILITVFDLYIVKLSGVPQLRITCLSVVLPNENKDLIIITLIEECLLLTLVYLLERA